MLQGWTKICAESLADHLREVADALGPLWTNQGYWTSERLTSRKSGTLLMMKVWNTYQNITNLDKRWKQSSSIKQLLQNLLLIIKTCTGFTTDITWISTNVSVSQANHFSALKILCPLCQSHAWWSSDDKIYYETYKIYFPNVVWFQTTFRCFNSIKTSQLFWASN